MPFTLIFFGGVAYASNRPLIFTMYTRYQFKGLHLACKI